MLRVALVNMPFVGISRPSLGLTQLQSLVKTRFNEQIETAVFYFNIDFARYLDATLYASICELHHETGLGDWFFRNTAFPKLADNADEYFDRYYPANSAANRHLRVLLRHKRQSLEDYLDSLILDAELDSFDIVGFTSTFTQNTASFAMARRLKKRNANIITLIGGANCETTMGLEICRQVEQIDFVFSGPALISLPRFLHCILEEDPRMCHEIEGVLSKSNTDPRTMSLREHTERNSGRPWDRGTELPIDTVIPLDYRGFITKLAGEFPETPPVLLFETSRGCWWGEKAHCTFCGLNGDSMAYRAMSPAIAVNELSALMQKYADQCAHFECVDNIMPKQYIQEVLPHLRRPPRVRLFYEVKADLSDGELATLASSGITVVQPGIESLSTPTLKLMKKGMTAFQNITFLKNCRMRGILPVWNILVGFPGESEEMHRKYAEDLPRLTHLFPPRGVFPIGFHRYSPYHSRPREFGLTLQPLAYYKLTYPFDSMSLHQLAYYFEDATADAPYYDTMNRWLPRLKRLVQTWINLWFGSRAWSHTESYAGPKLHFEAGCPTRVKDSRSGEMIVHDVGNPGAQILKAFDKPGTVASLAKQFGTTPNVEHAEEIRALKDRGLLIQEADHYLSLVHDSEPAATMQWFPW